MTNYERAMQAFVRGELPPYGRSTVLRPESAYLVPEHERRNDRSPLDYIDSPQERIEEMDYTLPENDRRVMSRREIDRKVILELEQTIRAQEARIELMRVEQDALSDIIRELEIRLEARNLDPAVY